MSIRKIVLATAAGRGYDKCLKSLLEAGADPNKKIECRGIYTPLTYAASQGHHRCVKLLLDATSTKISHSVPI